MENWTIKVTIGVDSRSTIFSKYGALDTVDYLLQCVKSAGSICTSVGKHLGPRAVVIEARLARKVGF